MATYDPITNTYQLTAQETNFGLPPDATDASLIGNALDNSLTGNDSDNFIDGSGGADTLIGGKGDDTYVLYDAADGVVVTELAGEGNDTILSLFDIDLHNYANVENVILAGSAVNAVGNDMNNELYGTAVANSLSGGQGDDRLDGGAGADMMTGGLGDDTYFVDDVNDVIVEHAGEGIDTVASYITYSLVGTELENLILAGTSDINGTGNDADNILYGNSGLNRLEGGKGNDELDGGDGADVLVGGDGNDTYHVDDVGDLVEEAANEGIDSVQASRSYTLTANVEHLVLVGAASIDGTGNDLDNHIRGNDNNNVLDGQAGADTLEGGKGNDTYVIDAADTVTELANEGTDTVKITDAYAPSSYAVGDNIENVTLAGTRDFAVTGNALANAMTGNGGANTLSGADGNDTLDGGAGSDRLAGGQGDDLLMGGAGADTMIGGAGNDLYFVDSAGDVVTEDAGGGTFDRVIAKVSYALTANVEYLALENAGGNINGTGNGLDNTMFGNDGNNVLDGGAGRDQLYGATGSDTVHGGDGNDSIHESGDDSDMLYGDAGDDSLEGEGGNDLLDGGTGVDHMTGGTGNDTYMVDNSLDVVTEGAGGGLDTVLASVSFALALDSEVEALTATGSGAMDLAGSNSTNAITGNAAANVLKGQDGNDTLKGNAGNDRLWGGAGKDVLYGGKGKDVFVFDTKPNKQANLDKIMDFSVPDDSIWLDNAVFKKLGKGTELKPGKLNSAFFTIGSKAKDKNDYLVYDSKKGVLYYDADGSGHGKAVEIATLKKGLAMTYKDFFVI